MAIGGRRFAAATAAFVTSALAGSLSSPSAYAGPASGPETVPGEVLVVYKPAAAATSRTRAVSRLRASLVQRFPSVNADRLRVAAGSVDDAVAALQADPAVAYVQPNFVYRPSATPNDPGFTGGHLWALRNTGQNGGKAGADIGAVAAWDKTTGSSSAVVAVIDSGIDYAHPDLAPNLWTNAGEVPGNGSDDDGNGYKDDVYGWNGAGHNGDPSDSNGHGTHVAGTIGAAGNNGLGVTGVAWNTKIVGCKFIGADGAGSTAAAIECIDYLCKLKDRGVNLVAVNASWGGSGYDGLLRDAINRLGSRGVLFVAAAGNDGRNNDTSASYPANFDCPNIVSVAATDRNDQIASFSNYGSKTVHIGAPGVEITSTYPGGGYATMSGTSMAAPHVTGAAALIKSYLPGLDLAGVKNLLLTSGDAIASLSGKTTTGRRLNVANALSGNTATPPPPAPAPATLSVRLTTNASSYYLGQSVTLTVKATDGNTGAAVSGAPVSLTVRTPYGGTVRGTGTTDSSGNASFRFSTSYYTGRGTYSATATVTPSGYPSGTATATFTVR